MIAQFRLLGRRNNREGMTFFLLIKVTRGREQAITQKAAENKGESAEEYAHSVAPK